MRAATILLVGPLAAAAAVIAQTTATPAAGPEPTPVSGETADSQATEESDGDSEEEPTATVTFSTDGACNVYVDGVLEASLEPGDTLEVAIAHGTLTLSAVSTDVPAARWEETVEIAEDEERAVDILMLEAIAETRKTERRQSVWRDTKRGLMWTRRDNSRDVTWPAALAYCAELELGGFDNWRLPSAVEIESIEAMWSFRPFKILDPFLLSACCAWSSTESTDGTAWNFDFRFRRRFEVNRNLSFGLRALCTRQMPADELADAILVADPKEQKRRLKEKRLRQEERKRRKEERRRARNAPDGG